tara:strand:- start:2474 stop:3556 length:1083 start_codon:yes stop_codon:yes gene_type:complete
MNNTFQSFGNTVDSISRFEEKVVRNQEWVNWGDLNEFPSFLYDMLDYNPTHNVCVTAKVDNVAGQGFVDGDKMVNGVQTLNEFFRELAWEYVTTGNAFIETVWSNSRGEEGLAGIYVLPSSTVRVQKKESIDDEQEIYYYCENWKDYKKKNIIEFNKLDPTVQTYRQIYHIKKYSPGYEYYGSPGYMSVINDIRLAHQISLFHLSNILQGGLPGLWVNFNESIPDSVEEQQKVLRMIEERFSGAQGAGRTMVSFSDGAENAPQITQIPTNTHDGYYTEIFDLTTRQILSGHKVTSGLLIGLNNGGGFGSNAEEIETSFKVFQNTTIVPIQQDLMAQLSPVLQLLYPNEQINTTIIQNQLL